METNQRFIACSGSPVHSPTLVAYFLGSAEPQESQTVTVTQPRELVLPSLLWRAGKLLPAPQAEPPVSANERVLAVLEQVLHELPSLLRILLALEFCNLRALHKLSLATS